MEDKTITIERKDVVFENDEYKIVRINEEELSAENEEPQVKEWRKNYKRVGRFSEGYALANKEEEGELILYIVDENGRGIRFPSPDGESYDEINRCADGMFRVSTKRIVVCGHDDHEQYAGICGYVDTSGNLAIPPQYIYAYEFDNGRALVCKGEWVFLEKEGNEYRVGDYYSKDAKWGMIDRTGKEVIPCIFDELECINAEYGSYSEGFYKAHYGGWEKGKWGIVNACGEWVAEPIFEDIGDEISYDGLFGYYTADYWSDPDNIPMGIFSIPEKRVIFEPEFLEVNFLNNVWISVAVIDKESECRYFKVIDKEGRIWLDSPDYRWVSSHELGFLLTRQDGVCGIIDEYNGKVIIPFEYKIQVGGISTETRRFIFEKDERAGVASFCLGIIVPNVYYEIRGLKDEFLTVYNRDDLDLVRGLLTQGGEVILPCQYSSILVQDDRITTWLDEKKEVYRIIKKPEKDQLIIDSAGFPTDERLVYGRDVTDSYLSFVPVYSSGKLNSIDAIHFYDDDYFDSTMSWAMTSMFPDFIPWDDVDISFEQWAEIMKRWDHIINAEDFDEVCEILNGEDYKAKMNDDQELGALKTNNPRVSQVWERRSRDVALWNDFNRWFEAIRYKHEHILHWGF